MDMVKEKNQIITSDIPEKFYEELYSKADILYFRVDEEFHIISCNVTAEEKLGYDKESLLDTSLITFINDSFQGQIHQALEACFQKGYIRDIELQFQTQENHTVECIMNGLTFQDEDASRFLRLYIRDITLHKSTYLANRLLSTIIEVQQDKNSTSDFLFKKISEVLSCDGGGISLRFKGGESLISGYWDRVKLDQDFGAKDFRRWHPQIWTLMIQKCQKTEACQMTNRDSFWTGYLKEIISILHEQGEKNVFESLAQYESMALISLEKLDQYQGYLVLLDRRSACWDEHTIAMLESISQDFVNAVAPGVVEISESDSSEDSVIQPWMNVPLFGILVTENHIIRHANPWIESNVGIPAEKLIGRSVKEIITEEFHEEIDSIEPNTVKAGHFKNLGNMSFKTYSGSNKYVECMLTALPTASAMYELWYWMENKQNIDLLAKLQESKKMEALGILTGGIVHDFDNLLSTIMGFATLLKEEIGKNNPLFNDVQQISDTTEKAVHLTTRLLAYAHGKSYIVDNLNVNQLVSEVAGILSRTLDKNIVIRADIEKTLYTIKADAGQIQQAILQVAINAKEAMPHGGSLVFQTRNLKLNNDDPRLRKGCNPGNYVQVVISDTGMGMSSQIKDQIFEPQFSTKDQSPGRGLGLSVVRQIIEQIGGFISVFSEIGKGTVFKIHIPANETTINRPKERTSKLDESENETILVVDDERLLRDTAKRMLIRYGYNVINTSSGHEAVAVFKKYVQSIDLIILDMIMPGTDITKTLFALRKLNPKIKILASLKSDDKKKVASELVKSCTGIIQKPFQIASLLKKVQSVLH